MSFKHFFLNIYNNLHKKSIILACNNMILFTAGSQRIVRSKNTNNLCSSSVKDNDNKMSSFFNYLGFCQLFSFLVSLLVCCWAFVHNSLSKQTIFILSFPRVRLLGLQIIRNNKSLLVKVLVGLIPYFNISTLTDHKCMVCKRKEWYQNTRPI